MKLWERRADYWNCTLEDDQEEHGCEAWGFQKELKLFFGSCKDEEINLKQLQNEAKAMLNWWMGWLQAARGIERMEGSFQVMFSPLPHFPGKVNAYPLHHRNG